MKAITYTVLAALVAAELFVSFTSPLYGEISGAPATRLWSSARWGLNRGDDGYSSDEGGQRREQSADDGWGSSYLQERGWNRGDDEPADAGGEDEWRGSQSQGINGWEKDAGGSRRGSSNTRVGGDSVQWRRYNTEEEPAGQGEGRRGSYRNEQSRGGARRTTGRGHYQNSDSLWRQRRRDGNSDRRVKKQKGQQLPETCFCRKQEDGEGKCYFYTDSAERKCSFRKCAPSYLCTDRSKSSLTCLLRKNMVRVVHISNGECETRKTGGHMYVPYV